MNDIQRSEPAPLAPSNPMQLMQSVIAGGITPQNVEVFGKLLEYQRDMEARDAEKQFNAAFVALQFELPQIKKTCSVVSKGVFMYAYAPFIDIMDQLLPLLKKHGFAVSFSQDFADNRIISTCTLRHIGGHAQSNKFSVRAGKGPPNSSEAQGDASNSTLAKRHALSNALNLVTDDMDDDARNEGDGATITADQAHDFQQRLEYCHGDKAGFLRMAGAASYISILAKDYDRLNAALRKKESQVPV